MPAVAPRNERRDRWQLAHLARITSAALAFLLIAVRQRPALHTATDHKHIDSRLGKESNVHRY